MRGVISGIVPDGTYGQIAADDGKRYSYWTSEVRNGQVKVGQTVEFQMWEGQPIDIFIVVPLPPSTVPPQHSGMPKAFTAAPAAAGSAPAGGGAAQAALAAVGEIPTSRDYWIKLFTSASGRISRRQFWLHGVLPIFLCSLLLGWIPLIGMLISLAAMWASICIGFKRFHDLGYPGWYSLLYLVPLIPAIVIFALGMIAGRFLEVAWLLSEILGAVSLLIALAQLIFVYIRPGQQGPNQYGPDPLAA